MSRLRRNGAAEETERNDADTGKEALGMIGEIEGIGMSVHGTTGGIGSRMTGTIADKAGIPVSAAEDVPGMCSAHF